MVIDQIGYTSRGGREHNEDYIGNSDNMFIVADGLGGHSFGEVASAETVKFMLSHFSADGEIGNAQMHEIIRQVNEHLRSYKEKHPEYENMASTVVAAFIKDTYFNYLNVGDSRMYLFRDGAVLIQSKDHSLTQLCVDTGEITKEQMRFHEDRNKLTKVLGLDEQIRLTNQFEPIQMMDKDAFLLCSDGFWEYITEEEMIAALLGSRTSRQWLDAMLKVVNANVTGDNDNMSALCVRVRDEGKAGKRGKRFWDWLSAGRRRRSRGDA